MFTLVLNFSATIKWKINFTVWALSIREGYMMYHRDFPNGYLVSSPVDFQIGMRAGRTNCHYIIMPFSDEIRSVRTFAVFQACYCISSYLWECRCTLATAWYSNFELETHKSSLALSHPITLLQYHWGSTYRLSVASYWSQIIHRSVTGLAFLAGP